MPQHNSPLHERFEKEFLPHLEALHSFAFHLCYNEEDADDLVQETFLKAFRFIDKFEEGTNAKAWLFKILKNAYINQYRKESKRPARVDYEDVAVYNEEEEGQVSGYYDLREDVFEKMIGDEVSTALNLLPEEFRTVILLCDIEGFSYEEISKIIDIPIGTVRSRLFRARNMLKEKLVKYASSIGYKDLRGDRSKAEDVVED
ncbi:MAG: sigma-70 family RNA polymerase sigma factor [Saprospiraceae bacterium]|nr:sigma-70 family RNA polymerase sigma factor [Saprospiraceae bacterium]MBK7738364.1 sigma-70 family RNA polymerase sigma factor [Saprospiraceae bacterium]MBK7913063.1 sigma-70 family RNA polymerase sigma factor [Saprospiraceae bacterium]